MAILKQMVLNNVRTRIENRWARKTKLGLIDDYMPQPETYSLGSKTQGMPEQHQM